MAQKVNKIKYTPRPRGRSLGSNGEDFVAAGGKWVDMRPIDHVREEALAEIDYHSEEVRRKFITPGHGQVLIYQEKSEEATDYASNGYPADTSSYPLIQAEADAYNITPQEAADQILAQKSIWIAAGAAMERARLSGKKAVRDAQDIPQVRRAVEDTLAELEAIE